MGIGDQQHLKRTYVEQTRVDVEHEILLAGQDRLPSEVPNGRCPGGSVFRTR